MAISLTCPHCGKRLNVRDDLAGKKGPCSGCQKPIVIPLPEVPEMPMIQVAPEETDFASRKVIVARGRTRPSWTGLQNGLSVSAISSTAITLLVIVWVSLPNLFRLGWIKSEWIDIQYYRFVYSAGYCLLLISGLAMLCGSLLCRRVPPELGIQVVSRRSTRVLGVAFCLGMGAMFLLRIVGTPGTRLKSSTEQMLSEVALMMVFACIAALTLFLFHHLQMVKRIRLFLGGVTDRLLCGIVQGLSIVWSLVFIGLPLARYFASKEEERLSVHIDNVIVNDVLDGGLILIAVLITVVSYRVAGLTKRYLQAGGVLPRSAKPVPTESKSPDASESFLPEQSQEKDEVFLTSDDGPTGESAPFNPVLLEDGLKPATDEPSVDPPALEDDRSSSEND